MKSILGEGFGDFARSLGPMMMMSDPATARMGQMAAGYFAQQQERTGKRQQAEQFKSLLGLGGEEGGILSGGGEAFGLSDEKRRLLSMMGPEAGMKALAEMNFHEPTELMKNVGAARGAGHDPNRLYALHFGAAAKAGTMGETERLMAGASPRKAEAAREVALGLRPDANAGLSSETTRRGQDVTVRGQDVGATTARRGQDMTDALGRDRMAQAGREFAETMGYNYDALDAKEQQFVQALAVQKMNARTSRINATKPPAPTGAMRNAEAAGLSPGTPEYADFLKGAGRTSVTVNSEKPLTESQSKMALFSSMQSSVRPVIDAYEDRLTTSDYWRKAAGDSSIANALVKTPEFRQYEAAAAQWAEGMLRLQTGAAATEDEIRRTRNTYFPAPGDDAGTVAFKGQLRQNAEAAIASAGRGYLPDAPFGDFSGFPAPAAPMPPPAAGPPASGISPDVRALGEGSMSRKAGGGREIDDLLDKYAPR